MKKIQFFIWTLFLPLLIQSISQAQWVQTNGPYGATVNCIAIKNDNIFAGTNSEGIFLSTNNGTNWVSMNSGLSDLYIESLCFSGMNIFAGTFNSGIFLSTNNGISWTSVYNGLSYRVALYASGNVIYAADYSGVVRSTDNGSTWIRIYDGSGYSIHGTSVLVQDSTILAGTTSGIIRSTDSGANWTHLGISTDIISFAESGTNIFACSRSSGIFFSTNNGTSWRQINNGLPDSISSFACVFSNGNGLFTGTNIGLYFSTDNGSNWKHVNNGIPDDSPVYSMAVKDTSIFAGTRMGMFLSTNNGENWMQVNNGMNSSVISCFASSNNNLFAGTWGNGIYLSTDNGTNWVPVNIGLASYYILTLAVKGNNIFAGTWTYSGGPAGAFLSTNNGASWTNISNGILPGSMIEHFAVAGDNIYAGTYWPDFATEAGAIYLSTNNGANWGTIFGLTSFGGILSLYASGNYIYFGASGRGYRSRVDTISWMPFAYAFEYVNSFAAIGNKILASTDYDGLFYSTDSGGSWYLQANSSFNSLTVSGNAVFAGGRGVNISRDSGATWSAINEGLTNYSATCLALGSDYIYAGIGSGIWKRPLLDMVLPVELMNFTSSIKLNNITLQWKTATELNTSKFEIERKSSSAAWNKIGELTAAGNNTSQKSYSYTDSKLASGKYSYRLKIVDLDGTFKYSNEIQAEISVPNEFSLSQNYPNPFNPSTTINYSLPREGNVKLTIYNVIGSKVATIVDEYKPAGNYSVQFNGSNRASGIYLYRLVSGNYSATKKLILMK